MDSKHSFGHAKLEYIPLSALRVHPKIQREFDEQWGNKLGLHWDPMECEPLSVVRENVGDTESGHVLIIDGQHRFHGAKIHYGKTDQMLPCWVYPDLTIEQQAKVFLGHNNVKLVKAMSKWQIRRIKNDKIVTEIEAILKERDLKISPNAGEGCVRAVAAVESIYTKHGPDILRNVLWLIATTWGRSSDFYDQQLLRGIAFVLYKVGKAIEPGDLSSRMAKHGSPSRLIGEARQYAKLSGVSVTRAMADILVNLWNKRRSEKHCVKL